MESVYQGLILTLTKAPIASEAELDLQPYRQYVELWRNLLNPFEFDYRNLNTDKKKEICSMIYDQFMHCLLLLIDKLDLSYKIVQNPSTVAGGCSSTTFTAVGSLLSQSGRSGHSHHQQEQTDSLKSRMILTIRPNSTGDFDTFINLVELSGILLIDHQIEHFHQWIFLFGKKIVRCSEHLPMVGGFYKLLELIMVLCDRLDFFQSIDGSSIGNHSMQSAVCFPFAIIHSPIKIVDCFVGID